jgi:hypothetical protein
MKRAYVTARRMGEKKPVTILIDLNNPVNLPYYESAYKDETPIEKTHVCKCCGKPVALSYKEREGQREPQLEFEHTNIKDRGTCPETFREELKLGGIFLNEFDMKYIGSNREALKKAEKANEAELKSMMREWSGKEDISENDIKSFQRLKTILLPMKGLDLHPEVLPALLVTLVDKTRRRKFSTGNQKLIGFAWEGLILKLTENSFLPGDSVRLCWGGRPYVHTGWSKDHPVLFAPTPPENVKGRQTTFSQPVPQET